MGIDEFFEGPGDSAELHDVPPCCLAKNVDYQFRWEVVEEGSGEGGGATECVTACDTTSQ